MSIQEFQNDLFQALQARFGELGFDAHTVADAPEQGSQVGETLLFMMPITENGDVALADLRFVGLPDERYYVQIFLTIFNELKEGYEELERAIPILNYRAEFGAYGMLPGTRQFWQKYAFAVRELDLIDGPEGFAVALLDMLDLIREQNTAIYQTITALASGDVKYSDAVQAGLIGELK